MNNTGGDAVMRLPSQKGNMTGDHRSREVGWLGRINWRRIAGQVPVYLLLIVLAVGFGYPVHEFLYLLVRKLFFAHVRFPEKGANQAF